MQEKTSDPSGRVLTGFGSNPQDPTQYLILRVMVIDLDVQVSYSEHGYLL
jgi:hypothetical protein